MNGGDELNVRVRMSARPKHAGTRDDGDVILVRIIEFFGRL